MFEFELKCKGKKKPRASGCGLRENSREEAASHELKENSRFWLLASGLWLNRRVRVMSYE
jgi:hypothetical protein